MNEIKIGRNKRTLIILLVCILLLIGTVIMIVLLNKDKNQSGVVTGNINDTLVVKKVSVDIISIDNGEDSSNVTIKIRNRSLKNINIGMIKLTFKNSDNETITELLFSYNDTLKSKEDNEISTSVDRQIADAVSVECEIIN